MKALIFNSGLGSRLGRLTEDRPKSMVELPNGESIFHRQLRILFACGVREFVVTTGPFPEQLVEVAAEFELRGGAFRFVHNPDYGETNYIYSLWLARDELGGGDVLMLHGDLVFDANYVASLLALPGGSYGSVDPSLPLPAKDFKARVADGEVLEVGVDTWGDGCVAFQAMYRLTEDAVRLWLDRVGDYVKRGETGVYAENAANEVFADMHVVAHPYTRHVLEEVDTPEDLKRVGEMIRLRDFADQPVFELGDSGLLLAEGSAIGGIASARKVSDLLAALGAHRPLIVADNFLRREQAGAILGISDFHVFSGYTPNPTYEQVVDAAHAYRAWGCDSVVSMGGGSAIDVAKCVKLWANLPSDGSGRDADNLRFTDWDTGYSSIPHLAIPTTAGTGSESTHFAVVYVDGVKTSVAHDCIQPDAVLLMPSLLEGLPKYQRKATMLDALCQAIESYWSVSSCEESRGYSKRAIPTIMEMAIRYVDGDDDTLPQMMRAANLAGKAINLTTTTLPHAMSYKLTSLYGLAHGHAVALCMPFAWSILLERGGDEVRTHLAALDELVAGSYAGEGAGLEAFCELLHQLELPALPEATEEDLNLLATSVNPQRMLNFPVKLSTVELRNVYRRILTP